MSQWYVFEYLKGWYLVWRGCGASISAELWMNRCWAKIRVSLPLNCMMDDFFSSSRISTTVVLSQWMRMEFLDHSCQQWQLWWWDRAHTGQSWGSGKVYLWWGCSGRWYPLPCGNNDEKCLMLGFIWGCGDWHNAGGGMPGRGEPGARDLCREDCCQLDEGWCRLWEPTPWRPALAEGREKAIAVGVGDISVVDNGKYVFNTWDKVLMTVVKLRSGNSRVEKSETEQEGVDQI